MNSSDRPGHCRAGPLLARAMQQYPDFPSGEIPMLDLLLLLNAVVRSEQATAEPPVLRREIVVTAERGAAERQRITAASRAE